MHARLIVLTLLATGAVALPAAPATARVALCDGKVATIVGTPGRDVLRGTPGDDVIAGLGARDRVFAGDGDDLICGGDGADYLSGGGGDDALFAGKAHGVDDRSGSYFIPDQLDGGAGDDFLDIGREPLGRGRGVSGTIAFSNTTEPLVVDLTQRSAVGAGHDTIIPRSGLRIVGTVADDVLIGSDFDEEFEGGNGSDVIQGNGGDDHLYGDYPGAATFHPDDDTLDGGAGKDVLIGYVGSDELRGGPGIDLVEANGTGPNQVSGGAGDDFLHLTLGVGDGVRLMGGPGRDDVTLDVHPTVPGPGKVLVNLGIEQVALDNVFIGRISSTERLHMGVGVPLSFYGSPGPDEVYAGGRLRAWTYDGNDVIWGSDLADRIDGGNGFDEVRAGRGRDTCLHVEEQRGCELP